MHAFNQELQEETYKKSFFGNLPASQGIAVSYTTSQIFMFTVARSWCCIIFKADGACLVPKLPRMPFLNTNLENFHIIYAAKLAWFHSSWICFPNSHTLWTQPVPTYTYLSSRQIQNRGMQMFYHCVCGTALLLAWEFTWGFKAGSGIKDSRSLLYTAHATLLKLV